MKTIPFIGTDLEVSPLGLGTVNFGTSLNEHEAFRQLDRFTEVGNLIDTAHVYGDWEPGPHARSERTIGKWLKNRGTRDKILLCTKGAHPPLDAMHISRVTPQDIRTDLEESLQCLCTDHIDLYFLHRDNPAKPVSEILACLEKLRKEGKIRYYGCSNWTLPRLKEACAFAQAESMPGFVCNQLMWSLAEVCFEHLADKSFVLMDSPTFAFHQEHQLNAIGYMALAKGYFSRRHQGEKLPESLRAVYELPANTRIYRRLCELSLQYNLSLTALSILYFAAQPFAAIPLVSYDNQVQMEEGLAALTANVPPELLSALKKLRNFGITHASA